MPAGEHRLCVWSEERLIGEVPLGGPAEDRDVIVGRGAACDIVLRAPSVSSRHAVVQRSGGYCWLRDLGSTNGTYLNGAQLVGQSAYQLYDHDVVEVPPFTLLCRLPGLERATDAAPALEQPGPASNFEHDVVIVTAGGQVIDSQTLERTPIRIGAEPSSDLVLAGAGVAGTHLVIERRDGGYHLVNATANDAVQVGGGDEVAGGAERPLAHREWFALGPFTLQAFLPSQLPLVHPEVEAQEVSLDATMALAPAARPRKSAEVTEDQAGAPAPPAAVFPALPGAEFAADSGGRPGTGFSKLVFKPGFVQRFYERFMAADPTVAGFFEGVDLARQRRMLVQAFALILLEDLGETVARRTAEKLTELHRARGIPRQLFEVWKECLLETVQEYAPELAEDQASRWREHVDQVVVRVAGPLD